MIKATDILEALKAAELPAIKGMPDARALGVIRATLATIGHKLDEAVEGEPLRVAGLGVFNTRSIEREVDGAKSTVTRTVFRRIAPPQKVAASE